jgi:hypothetical protein
MVGVGKSHRKDQDRDHGPDLGRPPGRTTRTQDLEAIEPGESLRIAATQLERLRAGDVPALENAIRGRAVLLPLTILEVRQRLSLAEQAIRSASARGAEPVEIARTRRLLAEVAPRVRQLLAEHDRLATPAANTQAMDRWLADDLERRAAASNDAMPLGVVTGAGPILAQAPTTQPAPSPTVDVAKKSRELAIDVGQGSFYQGSFVLTVSWGATGVGGQVGENEIKAFELTATSKLNRLANKLSAAALNDEANLARLAEGLTVNVELNLAEASLDRDTKETELDLFNVAIKLVGDVTKMLGAPKHLTWTIDGRIVISLKQAVRSLLLRRLRPFLRAQLDERKLGKALDTLGPRLESEKQAYDALVERKNGIAPGTPEADVELRKIEQELAERKQALKKTAHEAKSLGRRLGQARSRTKAALSKMKSGLAKRIAKVMAKKTATFVMNAVLKMIPGLNVISTILDVVEIISLLRQLDWDGGSGGGSDTGKKPAGDEPASGGASEGPITDPGEGDQPGPSSGPSSDPSPDSSSGPSSGPPSSPTEGPARDPAAKRGDNKDGSPPGPSGPDHGGTSPGKDDKGTASPHDGSFDGPITDPDQLKNVNDPRVIVEEFPIAIAAQWFQIESGQLVMTAAGKRWIDGHRRQPIDTTSTLGDAAPTITRNGDEWTLVMTFTVTTKGLPRQRVIPHSFFVKLRNGILVFEPFMMAGSAYR